MRGMLQCKARAVCYSGTLEENMNINYDRRTFHPVKNSQSAEQR
jgi:hypothetical protein